MLNIKKIAGAIAITAILVSPLAALAQKDVTPVTTFGSAPVTSLTGVTTSLSAFVNWAIIVFWILTVLFLIWAAVLYLTAGGDEEKIKEARQRVIYALIAAAIALLSTGLGSIATSLLKGGA
ncbi:hypothetical protein D4R51_00410 [bacterium]|nr:MAG: hypothetical protein D4R51_00410 [bacterium]